MIASGLLTDGPGWRWIFFINLPVGVLLILLAAKFLAADRPAAGSRHFDALGAATVTAGLLLFVYGLNRGVEDGWTSATTIGIFAAAVAFLAAFVRVEAQSRSPLVPAVALRVAADRSPIQHEVNGMIANNAEEFAEHVLRLWKDPKLCAQLGDAARQTVAQEFSPTRLVEALSTMVQ